jgi:hypothetical protein
LVSVILCVHNGERFLESTLQSLFAQDIPDWEAIAVIDGSHDESASILQRYCDPRLTVIWQKNGGAAAATAAGIALAKGEFVAFLDQDDLWKPDKLRVHSDLLLAHPAIDLTFSWFTVIDEHNREIGIHSARFQGCISAPDLLADFVIGGTSNVVVRRTAIIRAGGVDSAIPGMFDLDLFVRIASLRPANTIAIPRVLLHYRRHAGQITRNVPQLEAEWNATLGKLAASNPAEIAAVVPRAHSNMNRYFARLCYEASQYRASFAYLHRGFTVAPFFFCKDARNWLTLAASVAGFMLPAPWLRAVERFAGLRR